MSVWGRCKKTMENIFSHCDLRVMFSIPLQAIGKGNQCKGHEATDYAIHFLYFVVGDWYSCLVKAVLASQDSAHKHHCLQGGLTAGQESLWSIHPHRLGSTRSLSGYQKTLSVAEQGHLGVHGWAGSNSYEPLGDTSLEKCHSALFMLRWLSVSSHDGYYFPHESTTLWH